MRDGFDRLARQRLNDEAHAAFARDWPALEPAILDLYRRAREVAASDPANDQLAAARVALNAIVQTAYKRGYLMGAASRDMLTISRN